MAISHHRFETYAERGGGPAENDLLGSIDTKNEEYQKELRNFLGRNRALIENKIRKNRLTPAEREKLFREAAKLAESFQPENPLAPGKTFLRDFREVFFDRVVSEINGDMRRLGAYTSVDSPLDRLFGADGFFRVDVPYLKSGPIYLTFDFSLNEKKTGTSADILIRSLPDQESPEYDKALEGYATDLQKAFLRKLAEAIHEEKTRGAVSH